MRGSVFLLAKGAPSFSLWGGHLAPPNPHKKTPSRQKTAKAPPANHKKLLKRTIDSHAPKFRFAGESISLPSSPTVSAAANLRLLGPVTRSFTPVGVQGPLIPIIYEDKHYAFIAKPAGQGLSENTIFSHRVRAHGIAHRWTWGKLMFKLTPGASGIVTFAKHHYGKRQAGSKRLRERFRTRKNTPWAKWLKERPREFDNYLRMEYVALVHGIPDLPSSDLTPTLRAAITTKKRGYFQVEWSNVLPDLVCRFTVIASVPHKTFGHISALSITLHKGHADLVRAACAQLLRTPILGDVLYGGASMAWVNPFVDPADFRDEGLWGANLPVPQPPPSAPLFLPSDNWPKLIASGLAPPSLLTSGLIPSLSSFSSSTTPLSDLLTLITSSHPSSQPLFISASSSPASASSVSPSNSLVVQEEQEDAVAHLVVPLDSMGRFMASYFDEDDDDYYVEFEPDEEKFVAERAYQSALKTEQYKFHKEQNRAAYDTEDDQPQAVEEDSVPFMLHRSRMRFCPRPESGHIYDVTAAPPWKFLLHLSNEAALSNPLCEDLAALETVVRTVFKYCDEDSSDESLDMEE